MNPMDLLHDVPPTVRWISAGLIAVAALTFSWWHLRRAARALIATAKRSTVEENLTIVTAAIATVVAGQGMWQFLDRVIGDVHWTLRGLMFAFLEAAVVTSAVRARKSMRENFSAGIDGMAVWVLTCVSAALAAMEARSIPEALFRLAAPLVAAWLWERGMAIERHRITGRGRIHWRITPERMFVRIGLAESSDRTATEVDTHRRLTRVALAAKRVHQLREAGASDRKIRSAIVTRDRALDRAIEHTDLARDQAAQATLLDLVTALGGGDSITTILETADAPWAGLDHPAITGAAKNSEAADLAAAMREWTATIKNDSATDPEVSAAVTSMAAYIAGRHLPDTAGDTPLPVSAEVAQLVSARVAPRFYPAPAEVHLQTLFDTEADTSADIGSASSLVAAGEVANEVTGDVSGGHNGETTAGGSGEDSDTGGDTAGATESVTEAMRRHWQDAISEDRVPTGAELARAAGCRDSYGRRKRKEWLEELDGRVRRRLLGAAERSSA